MRTWLRASVLGAALVGALAAQAPGVGPRSDEGKTTIEWVAKALRRLGEGDLADRLEKDFAAGTVRFGKTDDPSTTAETGGGRITINEIYESEGARVKPERPWPVGRTAIVPLAAGIVHEYRHLAQKDPELKPEFEDPAWRDQESALFRWTWKLRDELEAAAGLPAGPERTKKLQEIFDLLQGIRSEATTAQNGLAEYEKEGWVTPGQQWMFSLIADQCVELLHRIGAIEAGLRDAGLPPAKPSLAGPVWVLTGVSVWPEDDDYVRERRASEYQVEGRVVPGSSRHTWLNPYAEPKKRFALKVTWDAPPPVLKPGETLVLTAHANDIGCANVEPHEGWLTFDPAFWISEDGAKWEWRGRFEFDRKDGYDGYVCPGTNVTVQFRHTVPSGGGTWLCLNIATGNTSWSKTVTYAYRLVEKP